VDSDEEQNIVAQRCFDHALELLNIFEMAGVEIRDLLPALAIIASEVCRSEKMVKEFVQTVQSLYARKEEV
jgi:hypothetical protein